MKILLFGGWGYERIGGTEGFTRNLAASLHKQNQDVTVLVHKLNNEKDSIKKGIKVDYVPRFPRIKYFLPLYFIRFLFIFLKALKICQKEKIDVVLIREPESLALLPLRIFGVKVIIRGCTFSKNATIEVDSHIKNKMISSTLKHIVWFYQRIIFGLGDLFIESSKKEIGAARKLTTKKIVYIPYAIDQKIFYPFHNQKRERALIYTGLLRPIKRIDLLIKLFDKIKEKHKDVNLFLVGPIKQPYSEESLRGLSKFGKDIIFFGENSPEKTAGILRKSYIFVQTASDFGNSPLEAAACGLPVVALGDFQEDFGIFAKNEEEFINSVTSLLKNSRNYKKESVKNEVYIKKNRIWDIAAQKYLKVFKNLKIKQ